MAAQPVSYSGMSSSRIRYVLQEAKSLDRNIALSRLTPLIVMIIILIRSIHDCISFFLRTAGSEPHDQKYMRLVCVLFAADPHQMLFAGAN
jgi:hypothetical protein